MSPQALKNLTSTSRQKKRQISVAGTLLCFPQVLFFLIPPFSNFGNEICPPEEWGADTVLGDGNIGHGGISSFHTTSFFLLPPKNITKHLVFRCFQGVQKETSGMKWINTDIIKMCMQSFKLTFMLLKDERSVLPSHINQSVDLHCISFDQSLYDVNIGL